MDVGVVGYPLVKVMLCFEGDYYSSLVNLIVRTPQDCLRGKTISIKRHPGLFHGGFVLFTRLVHDGRCVAGYGVLLCST